MENKALEIQQCRREIRELRMRLDYLDARVERLVGDNAAETVVAAVSPKPVERPAAPQPVVPVEEKRETNLEKTVGRNVFAVLASVLVLLGVGVFISTIYEHIPQAVKILAIYLFGFGLLGGGLVVYRKNENKFWLAVASCGLAELLVSVITSHSYFGVLSLTGTFALVLVWILGSFWLTKFQPQVFKTIGYVGFLISMILGLDLLTSRDTVMYLTLLGAYVILSVSFMVTHPKFVTMNTWMAAGCVLGLCFFLELPWYLPDGWEKGGALVMLGILGVFHGVYVRWAKLSRNGYPLFSLATVAVLGLFLIMTWEAERLLPILMGVILVLWFVGHWLGADRGYRLFFSLFGALLPLALTIFSRGWAFYGWYPIFVAAAYVLYLLTKSREIGWMGFVWFLGFWMFADGEDIGVHLAVFAAAAAIFAALSFGWLKKDKALETAWYVLLFWVAHSLRDDLWQPLWQWRNNREAWEIVNALFYALLAAVNTGYFHMVARDKEKIMRLTGRGVVVLVLQLYLLVNNLNSVGGGGWLVSTLGIAASLLILAHSLGYTFKTRKLMVWQFVKFSAYCWLVLALLDSPGILVNISLLVIAIVAIGLGFRLGHKEVRVYGLALSLLDVVGLVLFNIDYTNSLQLAGGIILCGGLCFVISFIYSRISKMNWNED